MKIGVSVLTAIDIFISIQNLKLRDISNMTYILSFNTIICYLDNIRYLARVSHSLFFFL